jgi:hypothetical protein
MQTFVQAAGSTERPMRNLSLRANLYFCFRSGRTVERNLIDQSRYDTLAAELQASLARERALRGEKRDLSQRRVMLALAQEFEHSSPAQLGNFRFPQMRRIKCRATAIVAAIEEHK